MLANDLAWPFFAEHHRRYARDLSSWLGLCAVRDDETDVDASCRAWVRALGEAGWLQACIAPLDVLTLCLSRDVLAEHGALADFAFAMQGLGSGAISLFGTRDQRDAYLPAVARGECIAGFALSEETAGSDVAALATTARREGGDYVIDGEKTWISNAGIAGVYTVFARTGEAGAKGLSVFIVDANAPGLQVVERIETISPHPLGTLRFERVRIPASQRIGEEGKGFAIAMATLDIFRSTVGAAALGFARRALAACIDRAATRELFGAPLGALQLTQSAIAEMATDVDASALLVYRAAWTKDQGAARVTREAAMAKWFATEAAGRVCDRAVQMFGGRGVKRGEIVERLYRDVRALRIYEGASEVQRIVIARATMERR